MLPFFRKVTFLDLGLVCGLVSSLGLVLSKRQVTTFLHLFHSFFSPATSVTMLLDLALSSAISQDDSCCDMWAVAFSRLPVPLRLDDFFT